MSATLEAVRAGVAALLRAVAGVENVIEETPVGFKSDAAFDANRPSGRLHRWIVRAEALPHEGGAGYTFRRVRVRIEGALGVARDAPGDGMQTDDLAARVFGDVIAALTADYVAGGAIDRDEGLAVEPPRVGVIHDGVADVQAHILRAAPIYTFQES